jgi:hypothetical protein
MPGSRKGILSLSAGEVTNLKMSSFRKWKCAGSMGLRMGSLKRLAGYFLGVVWVTGWLPERTE